MTVRWDPDNVRPRSAAAGIGAAAAPEFAHAVRRPAVPASRALVDGCHVCATFPCRVRLAPVVPGGRPGAFQAVPVLEEPMESWASVVLGGLALFAIFVLFTFGLPLVFGS